LRDRSHIEPLQVFVYLQEAQWQDKDSTKSDDLFIYPTKPWGKNTISNFVIDENGIIRQQKEIPSFLYGSLKSDLRNPPQFAINYKQNGRFVVHIHNISHHGLLKIFIDDTLALEKPLLMHPESVEAEEIRWIEQWQRYQGRLNKAYGVDIPAGHHTIRVENDSLDWMEVSYYNFEKCGIRLKPDLDVMGLMVDQSALLWIRNSNYSWKRVKNAGYDSPIIKASIIVPKIKSGRYNIEWWDTYSAEIVHRQRVKISKHAVINLEVPAISKDIACKIIRIPKVKFWHVFSTIAIWLLVVLVIFMIYFRERIPALSARN
jgi:hypothetical protein